MLKNENNKLIQKEVAMFEKGDNLCEIIYDGKNSFFVWLDELGNPNKTEFLIDDKIKYLPANNTAVKAGAIILPKGTLPYLSVEILFGEILAFIHKYVDVSEDFEIFSAYYILLSWIYDKLTTVPYLRTIGDFSTGKSRYLVVVGCLCYKPIIMAGTVTPAPLFRLIGFWKGTPLIDEADRKSSDQTDEITKILNCGFEKNKPVIRCEKDNPGDIQVFDVFGPKVIATRFPFTDSALESRCLTEHMVETERTDIPTILPPEFYQKQEELRQKLLMFRLKERANIDINQIQKVDLGMVERRLKQALSSFAVLLGNKPELLEKFKTFIFKYQQDLIKERETSFDGLIINFLLDSKNKNELNNLTSSDIAECLKNEQKLQSLSAATVGKHLKALGVETKPEKVDGKTKRVIRWNPKLMNNLFQKYNAEYWLNSCNNRDPCNQQNITVTAVSEVTANTTEHNSNIECKKDLADYV